MGNGLSDGRRLTRRKGWEGPDVQKLFARVRRWGRRTAGPAPPYEVVCSCGRALRGVRQARRQVVPCTACGRPVFVLPWSPLPPPGSELGPKPCVPGGRLGPWRLPLIAASATLAVLIVAFSTALPFLGRSAPPPQGPERPPDVGAMTTAGRRALADGDFHLTVQLLQSALDQDRQHPDLLSPEERRDLIQLEKQGDLLSRLSSRSLEEMVEEADQVRHDEEWKAHFEAEYKGKAVVFDDEVRFDDAPLPDGRRRPLLRYYRVVADGREVRLALEDLTVLEPLARERPQRMLFGGRLSAIERGPGGQWVVHFDPDSGVLLTDRGAAAAVCPAPLDPALEDWLRRTEPRP